MENNLSSSFGSFALRWLEERNQERLNDELALRTWYSYRRSVAGVLVPLLGELPLADIDVIALRKLKKATADIPSRGNQALDIARRILLEAERRGLRPRGSTPARQIRRHPEMAASHPAPPQAFRDICEVCRDVRAGEVDVCHRNLAAMFELIALTGARLSEIRDLEWSCVHLGEGSHGVLRLRRHKTVRRHGEKRIVLSGLARRVVNWLRPHRPQHPKWVFPSHCNPDHPYRDVQKPWRRLAEYAGWEALCIRDLRSGLATIAYDSDVPLEQVQEMLAHRSIVTTRRYTKISSRKVGLSYETVEDAIFGTRSKRKREPDA